MIILAKTSQGYIDRTHSDHKMVAPFPKVGQWKHAADIPTKDQANRNLSVWYEK